MHEDDGSHLASCAATPRASPGRVIGLVHASWYGLLRVFGHMSELRCKGQGSLWPPCRCFDGGTGEQATWHHRRRQIGAPVRSRGGDRDGVAARRAPFALWARPRYSSVRAVGERSVWFALERDASRAVRLVIERDLDLDARRDLIASAIALIERFGCRYRDGLFGGRCDGTDRVNVGGDRAESTVARCPCCVGRTTSASAPDLTISS